jgi:hypothetical protein
MEICEFRPICLYIVASRHETPYVTFGCLLIGRRRRPAIQGIQGSQGSQGNQGSQGREPSALSLLRVAAASISPGGSRLL